MLLRMGTAFQIDNPKNYPAEVVNELHGLLAEGVSAQPDPKRQNFYDLEADDRMFFIHVLATGTVILLATWQKRSAPLLTAQSDTSLGSFPRRVDLSHDLAEV